MYFNTKEKKSNQGATRRQDQPTKVDLAVKDRTHITLAREFKPHKHSMNIETCSSPSDFPGAGTRST